MKVKMKTLHRCLALLLCIMLVAALLPETTASAALDTPVVSAKKSGSAIKVSWKPITGAAKYKVFRKLPSDTKWTTLTTVTSDIVSYTDSNVKNGKTYIYTVRCVSKDGKSYTSDYDHTGAKVVYWNYGTPTPKAAVVDNGIKISWNSTGAALYAVYRYNGSGWSIIGHSTGTSLVDVSVSPATAYTYTVRCMSADKKAYTSDYVHAGVTITFVRNFSINSLQAVDGGVQLGWYGVSGISTYHVYRYTGQDWRDIGTTSSTTFTDTGADFHDGLANHTLYHYKIGYEAGGSKEFTPEKSITYYQTPELLEVVVDQGKFTVKWKAVEGCAKYRVFRHLPSDTKWTKLADVTTTTYTDTTVAAGLNYVYTVRCIGADGSYISGYDAAGIMADYIGMPTLISTYVANDGIHFKWNTVGGVTKYQVYRKTPSTTWAKYDGLQTATGEVGEYVDKAATSGQTYYYTVACDDGALKSEYDEKGLACTKLSNPVLKKAEILENGIQITWYGVDGAQNYRVFRKEASGTVWKALGDTKSLSFMDTTAANKGSYVYTVRCVAANGNYASGYDTTGLTATFYSTPTLVSAVVDSKVSSGTGTITVTWKYVEGVTKYSVYRRYVKKDGSLSAWTNLTHSATGSTYTDKPPVSGYTYIYTVRCSNGSSPISYYHGAGVRTYFLMTPALVTPSVKKGQVTVKWKYVDGAKGYYVYRKVPGGGWSKIATINTPTTLTYANTTNLVKGQQYIYTVRAIDGSNISGYLTGGISTVYTY